jgi:hypothetical protein
MRFIAGLAAGKQTLFARSSTTSRTTASEYLFRAGSILHGESGSVAPTSLTRQSASAPCAHRIRAAMTGKFAIDIRQSVKTQLKMRIPSKRLPNGFENSFFALTRAPARMKMRSVGETVGMDDYCGAILARPPKRPHLFATVSYSTPWGRGLGRKSVSGQLAGV